jgi:membrane-associated phospholipid phosphatase
MSNLTVMLNGDNGDNGDNGNNGDNGGLAAASGFVGRLLSPYTSGAMTTTRDGIVGAWRLPTAPPPNTTPDINYQMLHWEPRVRAHVINFELMSSLDFFGNRDGDDGVKIRARTATPDSTEPAAKDAAAATQGVNQIVKLLRPSSRYILRHQLKHVLSYADLRRDRSAEILSQLSDLPTFFASICYLRPDRARFTLELIGAFMDALVPAEMRVKHALASPRPLEYSPQIMPMILTPGHSSHPSGHAVEAFMIATVLSELIEGQDAITYGTEAPRLGPWRDKLMQLAARIAVNRVVAGVHFPVDNAAGMVLGLLLGRYFVGLARGDTDRMCGWKFTGNKYGDLDFPWRDILQAIDTGAPSKKTPYLRLRPSGYHLPKLDPDRSPVRWLWKRAFEEWPHEKTKRQPTTELSPKTKEA